MTRSIALSVLFLPSVVSAAVSTPYIQNFTGYTAGATNNSQGTSISDFIENNTAAYAVYSRVGGDASTNYLRGNIQSITSSTAVVSTNIAGGNDFTVTTRARAAALTLGASAGGGPATSMAFSLLAATNLSTPGADPAQGQTSNITGGYYSLSLNYLTQTIALTKSGAAIGTATGTTNSTWFSTSATFLTFTLAGVYSDSGTIDLIGTITDGTDTYTITATDSTAILSGNAFGYRSEKNGNGNTANGTQSQFTTQSDFFSLTVVPEPSGIALLSLGALPLLARRRR